MKAEGQCLNIKNEWGGAKVPGLEVRSPKGTARPRKEEVKENQETMSGSQEEGAAGGAGVGQETRNQVEEKEVWVQGRCESSKRYRGET